MTNEDEKCSSQVEEIILKIGRITSADDLEVTSVGSEIMVSITEENDLRELVSELCKIALKQREMTPVIGAICGHVGLHYVGEIKFRNILLQKVQKYYAQREELESTDRYRLVTSAMFLGEIFYFMKTDAGTPLRVLAEPVVTYLSMVLKLHLSEDPSPDIDEELIIVAKQLLQNGHALHQLVPDKVEDLLRNVTEIMIRHTLSSSGKLNLLAALGELWPRVNGSLNPRMVHATLAAKLGLCLNI